MPDSMNPTKPAQLLKPEGSRKIVVLNGSRQIDQVIKGTWTTLKVLPENGLPRGIYQLSEAQKPNLGQSGKPATYEGQLLHLDQKAAYQLIGGKIVEHDRSAFKMLEANGQPLTIGRSYGVTYLNGRSSSVSILNRTVNSDSTEKQNTKKKDHGHSL
ncbi:KfrB domain-containing protein [Acinetobacter baumannii]|uniref:KfrB domain-containing protein n=1 Tax=Acinetobacter baumannii TaxID=470 RepID=UPI0034E22AA1